MPQRPISSSTRASDQEQKCIIDIESQIQEVKYTPRKVYKSGYIRRASLLVPARREKCVIHTIPAVVILCLFTLWWFSYPVNLEIKDGRLVGTHCAADHEMPLPLSTRHVSLATSATSPIAPVPQDLTPHNETKAQPASKESFLLYENDEDFAGVIHGADREVPLPINTNHVALPNLESAAPPTAALAPQDLTLNNDAAAQPVRIQSFLLHEIAEAFGKGNLSTNISTAVKKVANYQPSFLVQHRKVP